jgi:hypothetical protein
MKTTFASIIVSISAAMTANAACSFGGSGSVWNFRVYTSTECTGLHHLEYFGSHEDICDCFNIGAPLSNEVKSFVFTSSTKTIHMFKGSACSGTDLGQYSRTS